MKIKLENKTIKAEIDTFGAEIVSIVNKTIKQEFIWNGDEKFWNRHSPTLFPITGRLPSASYIYNDTTYTLPPHGFAKEKDFKILTCDDTHVTMQLLNDEETLKIYPFRFELICTFTLSTSGIIVKRTVKNLGNNTMYYSIGEHTGIDIERLGWNLFDCDIIFDKQQSAKIWNLKEGLLYKEDDFCKNTQAVPMTKELFEKYGCVVLSGLNFSDVALKNNKNNAKVTFSVSKPCTALVIWINGLDSPFICVEPWYGLPSNYGEIVQLKDKPCIINLTPNQEKSYEYTITI